MTPWLLTTTTTILAANSAMSEEFKSLLAAYNATHSELIGAMSLYNAVHQHLGSAGKLAANQHEDQLLTAHRAASAALNAYLQRPSEFTASYDQQQAGLSKLAA